MEAFDLKDITLRVAELCREATEQIIEPIAQSKAFQVVHKDGSGRNMVTEADLKTERFLKSKLASLLPSAGFLAEESATDWHLEGLNWIIDPIDGTTNFMHQAPPYCISVALASDEEILLGVVHEISNKETFYAWQQGGAFVNGKPIQVSKVSNLKDSLLVTGFPYEQGPLFDDWILLFGNLTRKTQGVRRYGAAAVDMCYVASGRIDGYYEYNLNPWDVAAGAIIVKEALGMVSDFFKTNDFLLKKNLLVSNGALHDQLHESIADFAHKWRQS